MRISILNGPNLNMLGKRDPEQYGNVSMDEILAGLRANFRSIDFEYQQSNTEGQLIDIIHQLVEHPTHGLIYNFGAYTHTSIALRDALDMLTIPKIEVHLSNIHARETFRNHSYTAAVSDGMISGFGMYSYFLGVQAMIVKLQGNDSDTI